MGFAVPETDVATGGERHDESEPMTSKRCVSAPPLRSIALLL
jgi:hypothetical protein